MLAAMKASWFWYSILAILCWGGWALFSKLGSREIPSEAMIFLLVIATLPVAVALLGVRRFRLEKSPKGIIYSMATGVATAIGMLALFAAFRQGGNTAVIMVSTSLYPMITVIFAVLLLRERLTKLQVAGLFLAAAAIVLFSL
jgi:uncharacterized membrane protein